MKKEIENIKKSVLYWRFKNWKNIEKIFGLKNKYKYQKEIKEI